MSAPSAPISRAAAVSRIASAVEFEPVPAITGTRFRTCSIVSLMTLSCSACVSVADSPVEPHGTRPSIPLWICHSIRSRNARASTSPSRNGVTSAVNAPLNIVRSLPPFSFHRDHLVGAKLDRAPKNLDGIAGHENVIRIGTVGAPFDFKIAAAQFHRRSPIGVIGQHCRDQRRACSRAASPSLARAALPYPHLKIAARGRKDELGVHAAWKERMMLELAAQRGKIAILELEYAVVGNENDAMRIAHRDRRDRFAPAPDLEQVIDNPAVGVHRNFA